MRMIKIITACLCFLCEALAIDQSYASEWFFHSYNFPDRLVSARLGAEAGWKQNSSQYCSARLLVAADNIAKKIEAAGYSRGEIRQGLIAVRLDQINGQDIDLYLYCTVETSTLYTVAHTSEDGRGLLWRKLYKFSYEEFSHEGDR